LAQVALARLIVAGFSGDAGKTLVTTGLIRALRKRGVRVSPFKKGPDYIDTAWLGAAAAATSRNLDTYLIPAPAILSSLAQSAQQAEIAVIEGNRGLFDGLDAAGSHSTAQLAKLISAPIVLIIDASRATRTHAALVLGCRAMDPELNLAGVLLNRVGTRRQEALIREAITQITGLPVLGAIPRLPELDLPSRHLGLVTVAEHPRSEEMVETAATLMERYTDLDAILGVARKAPPLEAPAQRPAPPEQGSPVRIAVARDEAFSFYYPENFTALEEAGADLVPFSPLTDESLPAVDALYLGGGFPEVYGSILARNRSLRGALAKQIAQGLPVWAECGGLMYLAKELIVEGVAHPMVGALPIIVEQAVRPQGHGYVAAQIDRENRFLPDRCVIRGHEFHYSFVKEGNADVQTVMALDRGTGVGGGRDGIQVGNCLACFTHFHALGVPDWAPGFVRMARRGCLA